MSRHIRIPLIVDIHRVTSSHLILQEANNPDLDRDYIFKGPLLNRLIIGRMKAAMYVKKFALNGKKEIAKPKKKSKIKGVFNPPNHTKTKPFPSAESLFDVNRIANQGALEGRLIKGQVWDEDLIKQAAKHVRSETKRPIEQTAQELTGRLFDPNFNADDQTIKHANRINLALSSFNPFRWLIWIATGSLNRAHYELAEKVNQDFAALHAISIAFHNITRSLEIMSELYQNGNTYLSIDEVLARCMKAPEQILRQSKTVSSSQLGPLRPGTLVVFSTHAAAKRHLDHRIAFMTTSPSKCPAHQAVPSLLTQVWTEVIS